VKIALVAGVLVLLVVGAVLAQHRRFLSARRDLVQDRQDVFHPGRVFHVVSYLKLAPAADLFAAMRALRDATDAFEGARMIYAGKVVLNALPSSQLVEAFGEAVDWDALSLVQLSDRSRYEAYRRDDGVEAALERFAVSYSHGMRRSAVTNLLLPQLLLAKRVARALTLQPSILPFQPAPIDAADPVQRAGIEKLLSVGELGRDAVLVANLTRRGTAEQRAADAEYTGAMLSLMAERGNGPMHMGEAVTLEGAAVFDRVALVYYPGARYFHDMATSTFYQGILGDKQLGDTQASITVPILDRL
jgi:hypothetical protein